jgi:ribonuclease E
MKQKMVINAVHPEQKRMANVDENGKLIEFNIQMSFKEPITSNIYKGVVLKVERGLQAAFVDFGGKKDGFLPLRDVSHDNFTEQSGRDGSRPAGRMLLKPGQEILVQVLREVSGQKGALLTAYISLPGRYLVLLPNKQSSGVSRKIEDESDRKRLKDIVEQIKQEEEIGFIVRTAGMNRTKQELARDYQHLLRLWEEIQKKAKSAIAPALIYQESDFGVRTLRDYFTPEISEILVDDVETFKKMRIYCKAVVPRNLKMITLYKEKTPIFDKYHLEDQIRSIYQERVDLKAGGYIVIKPTEAMITIDVNSGRASNKRNVEETAYKTNIEAAEEIARQLRLRDLGGLIVIDFIDMEDRKNIAEVEKTFKKALSIDRARIQLARISKFGILELSRQKKHSTIQEISYITCPLCHGSGTRPSLEYMALSAFRKIESRAVKGASSKLKVSLPYETATYLLNQKRNELCKLEATYDMTIHIAGVPDITWDTVTIEAAARKTVGEASEEGVAKLSHKKGEQEIETKAAAEGRGDGEEVIIPEEQDDGGEFAVAPGEASAVPKKKSRRRRRNRHRKPSVVPGEAPETSPEEIIDEGFVGTSEAAIAAETPLNQAPDEAVTEIEKPLAQETVAVVAPAELSPVHRRPAPRRRKKKTAPTTPAQGAIPASEAGEIHQEKAVDIPSTESSTVHRRPASRHRKKKASPGAFSSDGGTETQDGGNTEE